MSVTAAIAGGAAALLGNVISGIVGSKSQNDSIDKQIAAQKEENAKTREHNLQLAQLQNTMNVKQWERENLYNSPAAQMSRFQAAGLNPNLIYGQSNTSGQISGSLTSGAPATPVDMSALGNKRSGLASAFKAAGDAAMQIPMYREQVRGLKLDNDAKQFENDFKAFIHTSKYDPLGILNALKGNLTPAQRKYLQGLQNDINQGDSLVKDIEKKELENALSSKTFDSLVDKLASEAKISKENADYLAKSAVYRLDAEKYQAELYELQMKYQQNKNHWMDWDRWINHGINAAHAVGDILALKNIFGMFSKKKQGVLESGGKGYWKKTAENTWEWTGN